MRIYGVFKATHSRMHVKWGLGPARVRRGRTVPNEMNQKCPWMGAGAGADAETGTGAGRKKCHKN